MDPPSRPPGVVRAVVAYGPKVGALVTCVAVWIDPKAKVAHMAADTQAADASGLTFPVSKIVTLRNEILMGVAGMSATMPLIRRARVAAPTASRPTDHALDLWAQDIAEKVTALQLEAGIVENDDARSTYGAILLAYRGRAWEITTNIALPVKRGYHAIGGGDAIALGVMWATCRGNLATPGLAAAAVEAAIEHCVDCGGSVDTAST